MLPALIAMAETSSNDYAGNHNLNCERYSSQLAPTSSSDLVAMNPNQNTIRLE